MRELTNRMAISQIVSIWRLQRSQKSSTGSLQDVDGFLIIHSGKPKESTSWKKKQKQKTDFHICLLLRNKIELQVPPNQKNLLNTQGFSLSYQKSLDRITRMKWNHILKKKKNLKSACERMKVIFWYSICLPFKKNCLWKKICYSYTV